MKLQALLGSSGLEDNVQMKARQKPLTDDYRKNPEHAMVLDSARTSSEWITADNPLATSVLFDKGDSNQRIGVHTAVGGESDNPTPGDVLCGAIACCLDSTIRIVANRFNLHLRRLSVEVVGKVDVRGTLRVDSAVPVAFQTFDVVVDIKPKGMVPAKLIDRLLAGAEQSCIVIQSLRGNCDITVRRK